MAVVDDDVIVNSKSTSIFLLHGKPGPELELHK